MQYDAAQAAKADIYLNHLHNQEKKGGDIKCHLNLLRKLWIRPIMGRWRGSYNELWGEEMYYILSRCSIHFSYYTYSYTVVCEKLTPLLYNHGD
jgi:hypothetical protein